MSKVGLVRAGVGIVVAVSLSTACGTGDGPAASGSSAVTVPGLIQRMAPVDAPTTACPVPFDPAAAAKADGIQGLVAPADEDPVTASTSDSAEATDPLRQLGPAVRLECDYSLGDSDLTVYLLASTTPKSAVTGALPEVAFLTGITDLSDYVTRALAAAPGVAVAVPDSGVAGVQLDVADGDGALVVGIDPGDGISDDQLTAFTESLARQVS